MPRLSSLLLLSALVACKTAIAPANDDYFLGDEVQGRTDLGHRATLVAAGLTDVTAIGHQVAVTQWPFSGPSVRWTETSTQAPCDRRVRSFGSDWETGELDPGDGRFVDCGTPGDPLFGHDLHSGRRTLISGDVVDHGPDTLTDPAVLEHLAAPGRSLDVRSTDDEEVVAIGLPAGGRVAIAAEVAPDEGWEWSTPPVAYVDRPAWLSETAGFGTDVWLGDDLLIVTDAVGGFHFYEISVSAGEITSTPVHGPAFDILHAVSGSDLLVERAGMWDLEILRYSGDGSWISHETLVNAAGGYTRWVMDEVAAFAVTPREGRRRGAVDRWNRLTGHLDGSLTLVRPHDDVDLALDGETLVVAESGELGAVHVFDWTEARTRLFAERGGVYEQICLVPDAPLDSPVVLREHWGDADSPERYHQVGDAGSEAWDRPDDRVAYSLMVPGDHLVTIRLANPLDAAELPPDLTLLVDDETVRLPHMDEDDLGPEGLTYTWYNHGSDRYYGQKSLILELDGEDQGRRTCRAFDLTIDLEEVYNFCHDGWDWYDSIDLLPRSGEERTLTMEKPSDLYDVELAEGETLVVQREGDVDMRLLDAEGDTVATVRPWRDPDQLTYTADPDDVAPFTLMVDRRGRYGSSDPVYAACTPYTLHAHVTPPVVDEEVP